MASMKVSCRLNHRLTVTVHSGHFATRHSHNSHYIDITELKHRHVSAMMAAMELAGLVKLKNVDTILCLDGSEVVGGFLAHHLAKREMLTMNSGKNINVVSPEYDSNGQLIFRDNLLSMIKGQDVLILISTINSGKTIRRTLECVEYYGGRVQGITSIFSTMKQVGELPVYTLFSMDDVPHYITSSPEACPMCAQKQKITAIANSYGLSKL